MHRNALEVGEQGEKTGDDLFHSQTHVYYVVTFLEDFTEVTILPRWRQHLAIGDLSSLR